MFHHVIPLVPKSRDKNPTGDDHDRGHDGAPRDPLELPQKQMADDEHPDWSGAAQRQRGGDGGKGEGSGQEKSGDDVDAPGGDEPEDIPAEGLPALPAREEGLPGEANTSTRGQQFYPCQPHLHQRASSWEPFP